MVLFTISWRPGASAEPERTPPLLLGGAPAKKVAERNTDPGLPTGAPLASSRSRPAEHEPPACSARHPVCIHRSDRVAPERALRALELMESAFEQLALALGLPAPLIDAEGGSNALDLYLVPGSKTLLTEQALHEPGFTDRAALYCVLGSESPLPRGSVMCVAEAIAARLDAGETPHARRAFATLLWWIVGTKTPRDLEAVDDFQAHPEQPLASRELDAMAEGSAMFWEFLESRESRGGPGKLAAALLSLSSGRTPNDAARWHNEPDWFDVLRRLKQDEPAQMATLLSRFAVARAFAGSRSNAHELGQLDFAGEFGRVRFDWVLDFSSLPRRVLVSRPLAPTGAVYLWLELDDVPLGATLGFRAEWEPPVAFHFTLVRVDREGRLLSRLEVPFQERGTEVEQRLVDLEAAAGVMVIGVNMGGVDLAHPFDPDFAPFEPHACTLHLAKL